MTPTASAPIDLVVIGASTGGPQALALLLGSLPPDFEPAVLIVQHIAADFLDGLATWLDGICPLPVRIAYSGQRLAPGTVTIAPAGHNLIVGQGLRVTCEPPSPTQFHVPGVDVTLHSVATSVGPRAIGVLLTGMGRDGADGLRAMYGRGSVTIGQDEATSAVWGMPGVAYAIGAVQHVLPLPQIAPAIAGCARGFMISAVGGES